MFDLCLLQDFCLEFHERKETAPCEQSAEKPGHRHRMAASSVAASHGRDVFMLRTKVLTSSLCSAINFGAAATNQQRCRARVEFPWQAILTARATDQDGQERRILMLCTHHAVECRFQLDTDSQYFQPSQSFCSCTPNRLKRQVNVRLFALHKFAEFVVDSVLI